MNMEITCCRPPVAGAGSRASENMGAAAKSSRKASWTPPAPPVLSLKQAHSCVAQLSLR